MTSALILASGLTAAAGFTARAGAQSPPAQARCGTTQWVGAWTADPSGLLGPGSSDQTIRIILAPHLGGDRLRVHVSNRFGSQPVIFTRAAVALRLSGAALVAGSGRQLTFAGQPSVTVPPGGEAVSDPASLTFGPFQDLAVSLYLADPTGPASGHYAGRERSYATAPGSGDQTGGEAAGPFVSSTTTVAFVDGVDALVPAGVGAAVLLGDSITDGYQSAASGGEDQSGIDANKRFPDFLARRLLAEPGGPRLSVLNAGISGNRLLGDGQQGLAGPSALSRLDADVLGVAGVTDAIVLEGVNDIATQPGVSALITENQVISAFGQIVARLHARGVNVQLGTIIPAGLGLLNIGSLLPGIYIDSQANVLRLAVNNWIRSGATGADGVIDFDAAVRAASISNELDPGLDSGDHVHPNSAGYGRMADAVNLSSLRGAQCAARSPRLATTLRDRARTRSGGRQLRVTGNLLAAGPADCTGTAVVVRALKARRTILRRHLRMTPDCRFAATSSIRARGRIEIRVSFAGNAALRPTRARSVFLRLR